MSARLPDARRRTAHRWRAVVAALLTAVVLLTLGACASIPRSGGVNKSQGNAEGQAGDPPEYYPSGPRPGESPESVVEDFYTAGNSYKDDYAVARQFLAQDASVSWKPDASTLVYRSAKVVKGATDKQYVYELDLAYSIDAQGIITSYPQGTVRRVPLTLGEVDGEWRIAKVGDGTAIPEGIMRTLYQAYVLYFYDPGYRYAVPDARWFINRSTVTKSIVSAVLGGPAPYLKGAVVSAFPTGARLAKESVPVVNRTAQVDLTQDLLQSPVTDRRRMINQLTASLEGLSNVSAVQLLAGGTTLSMDDSAPVAPPIVNPSVPDWQVAVLQGQLNLFQDNTAERIPGLDTAAYLPRHPAAPTDRSSYAFLNQQGTDLFLARPSQPVRDVLSGSNLLRPSYDSQGWLWSGGDGAQSASLTAMNVQDLPGGKVPVQVVLSPGWMKGLHLKDAQLSRDGTRILILTGNGQDAQALLAGVVRGADGAPRELTDPIRLPEAKDANQGAWLSDTSVVLGNATGTGVDTPSQLSLRSLDVLSLPDVTGLQGISAGNGSIYVQTPSGISQKISNGWVQQGTGVKDPKFAG
ncbi:MULTISPECIES: LpqB family beta-propeller domain-containing protein [Arthrobacter]|uniref:LpqB family beta-propeller domain-containing protein n=2 Tax=Arthrobacter TaxID=1663 RepID=A0ABU9KL89_9MICC|nr:LpqB family beta-propeller domain-containing protein [Arthrobacter sp. YJM1]MDP5227215.1 LpqB family beta-propeller domain-containing protein [Arthrobacter sp. YJM1]